jgi:hypothetical protein
MPPAPAPEAGTRTGPVAPGPPAEGPEGEAAPATAGQETPEGGGEEGEEGAEVEGDEGAAVEGEEGDVVAGEGEVPPAPAAGGGRGGGFLPQLDVFFPEGDLDLRVSRLIDKVFFGGQVMYNFVDGDITAILHYRYYGYRRTYQLAGFDSVEFDDLEDFSDDFERVRGFLMLAQWPTDYHHRTVLLAEIDRIISNKEVLQFDNNKTNTFLRLGYQIGTPHDPSSNAVLGDRRAQRRTLFTAFRDIGPGDFGLTSSVTYGFTLLGSDFEYGRVEVEGLKRFDLPRDLFLIGRVHAGSFLLKEERPLDEFPPELAGEIDEADLYAIPRSELFRLDGRSSLKGLDDSVRGTEQLFTTVELFAPWFRTAERRALGLTWDNWYWILYGGYGVTGFDRDVYSDGDLWVPDVGIGFESSFRLRKYTFFLSGIIAQALEGEGDAQARLSIKSYR